MGRRFGEFSLIKADRDARYANIGKGDVVKLLIPSEFGGGYIRGKYDGAGLIVENGISYSIYELAGIWNSREMYKLAEEMGYENPARKPYIDTPQNDKVTERIQNVGLMHTANEIEHARAEFPIKIVTADRRLAYEECQNISLYDRNKGCKQWEWKDWKKVFGTSSYEDTIENALKAKERTTAESRRKYAVKMVNEIKGIIG